MKRGRPRLSPWIDGMVRPVRIGVYQRGMTGAVSYSRWDGMRWLSACLSKEAAAEATYPSGVLLPWRGLASKP